MIAEIYQTGKYSRLDDLRRKTPDGLLEMLRLPGLKADRVRKRLAKAEVKLGQTRAALDIMGKAFALLEMLSESADSPPPSAR